MQEPLQKNDSTSEQSEYYHQGNQYLMIGFIMTFCLLIFFFIMKNVKSKQNESLPQKRQVVCHKQILHESVQRFIGNLDDLQKDLIVNYSFYKQVLYLKIKIYHSTNLTSIYSILKKSSSDPEQLATTFEDNLLKVIRKQIKVKTEYLISQTKQFLNRLKSSQSQITYNQSVNSNKAKMNQKCRLYKVSDLFKYNIRVKKQVQKVQQSANNLQEKLKQIEQKQLDKSYVDIIQYEVSVISNMKTFIDVIKTKMNYQSPNQQNQKSLNLNKLQKRIEDIHQKVNDTQQTLFQNINSNTNEGQLQTIKSSENQFVQLFDLIDSFIINKKSPSYIKNLPYTLNTNPSSLYQMQIKQIQIFQEKIRILKQKIITKTLNTDLSNLETNKIKIYHSLNHSEPNNNEIQTKILHQQDQLKNPNKKDCQNSLRSGQQLIFSKENKLSFMKQLDRLMIRNRIKKQMQEMDKKMKQQQEQQINSKQEIDQTESQSNVILQKM